ncbi:MAG: energy transducer TonB [Ginsengibacter sp.]
MEANQILQTGFLDILFEGKNKLYGAYDLRKTYNQRITKALFSSMMIMLALVTTFIISKRFEKTKAAIITVSPDNILRKIEEEKPKPFPKLPTPVHVATVQVTKPVIVKKIEVPPPDIHQIQAAEIDVKTVAGPKPGIGIVNPPTEIIGSKIIAKPVKKESEGSTFIPIEVEAKFPGGEGAWQKYIQKAIQRELDEFTETDYGTCTVKFIVDANGSVSNVEAITMKGTRLAEIAVSTISKGPKWIPAMQNGRYVTAYRVQPVTLLNPNQ